MMIMKPTTTPGKESGSVMSPTTALRPGKSLRSKKIPVKAPSATDAIVTRSERTTVEKRLEA